MLQAGQLGLTPPGSGPMLEYPTGFALGCQAWHFRLVSGWMGTSALLACHDKSASPRG